MKSLNNNLKYTQKNKLHSLFFNKLFGKINCPNIFSNEFCCVSNKNYCKTRKRPRSSAITGQRTQFSHLLRSTVYDRRVIMGPNACQLSVKFEAICQ